MSRPVKRPRADHAATAALLRLNPGLWQPVSVHRSSSSAVSAAGRIRSASARGTSYAPAGAYDAEVRVCGDEYAVHARWLGPEREAAMRRRTARAEPGTTHTTTIRSTRHGGTP